MAGMQTCLNKKRLKWHARWQAWHNRQGHVTLRSRQTQARTDRHPGMECSDRVRHEAGKCLLAVL